MTYLLSIAVIFLFSSPSYSFFDVPQTKTQFKKLEMPHSSSVLTTPETFNDATEEAEGLQVQAEHITAKPLRIKTFSVGKKTKLPQVLKAHGFTKSSIATILEKEDILEQFSLDGAVDALSETFEEPGHRVLKFYDLSADHTTVFWQQGKKAGVEVLYPGVEKKVIWYSGVVGASLEASLGHVTRDYKVVRRFLSAYLLNIDVKKDIPKGSPFSLAVERLTQDGIELGSGHVRATSLVINGENHQRVFVRLAGGGSFVSPNENYDDRPLFAPLKYDYISSLMAKRRFHPKLRRRIPHNGVDLRAAQGTLVVAAEDGVITEVQRAKASGNYVVIKHADGYESHYVHLSRFSDDLYSGMHIRKGQILGQVGCTGYCTKPHLHFSVKKDGVYLDPLKLIRPYTSDDHNSVDAFLEENPIETEDHRG